MRGPALNAWIRPRTTRDLARFFRAASRWAGYHYVLDGGLHALAHRLDEMARPRALSAFRAMSVSAARTCCRVVWDELVAQGLIVRSGVMTEFGRDIARSLARAARLDRGLGHGLDRSPGVTAVAPVIPTTDDIPIPPDWSRPVMPIDAPVTYRPNPIEGWDDA